MADPISGYAIGSAISAGGGIVSNIFNNSAIDKQNRYNLDLWNKQNEYNTPKNQMDRFKQAGLNPHLIYGQGNSGNAGAPTPSAAKSLDLSAVGNAVKTYLELKAMDTNIENTKEKTRGQTITNDVDKIKQTVLEYMNGIKSSADMGEPFRNSIASKRIDLETKGLEHDVENKDYKGANIAADTLQKRAITKLTEARTWLPQVQENIYRETGKLPSDDATLQIVKDIMGMFGIDMSDSFGKFGGLSKIFGKGAVKQTPGPGRKVMRVIDNR